MKIAVVLFNLGGPDKKSSIRPYLKNFFMDKAILPAPRPFRDIVSFLIARKRSKKEAGSSYARLGHRSPLLRNTQEQAEALQTSLGPDFKIFVCMRYWHPMADAVARHVKEFAPDKIVLLPLYPQFSTTTTGSSFDDWNRAARQAGLSAPTMLACCYPLGDGFIKASADNIRAAYEAMEVKPRVLFSAHGVPLYVIGRGDPYAWQCSATVKAIVKELGIDNLDYAECYQSRVGPVEWTTPSVERELQRAARDNVPVLIYPHAFVSEHVETLVEIEEEYRHLAQELGVPGFARVPTVSSHPDFIAGLDETVKTVMLSNSEISGSGKNGCALCPEEFKACARRQYGEAA